MPAVVPYQDLGGFPLTAVADPTGRNPFGAGYQTILVDADTTFKTQIPLAEVYHLFINAPAQASFQVWKNQLPWDNVLIGANAWDPSIPMPLRSGDTIYFFFNLPFAVASAVTAAVYIREPFAYQS